MITIDRLILSVDAMTPDRAERLVKMAAQQLEAGASRDGAVSVVADRIDVALPAAGVSDAAIAAALSAAIKARLG